MSFISPTFILRPFTKAFMPKFQTVNKTYFIGESTSTEFQKSHPFNVETENPLQSSTTTASGFFHYLEFWGYCNFTDWTSWHQKIHPPGKTVETTTPKRQVSMMKPSAPSSVIVGAPGVKKHVPAKILLLQTVSAEFFRFFFERPQNFCWSNRWVRWMPFWVEIRLRLWVQLYMNTADSYGYMTIEMCRFTSRGSSKCQESWGVSWTF